MNKIEWILELEISAKLQPLTLRFTIVTLPTTGREDGNAAAEAHDGFMPDTVSSPHALTCLSPERRFRHG